MLISRYEVGGNRSYIRHLWGERGLLLWASTACHLTYLTYDPKELLFPAAEQQTALSRQGRFAETYREVVAL
jgi:hypothetical protein